MRLRDRTRPLTIVAACTVPIGALLALNESLFALVVPATIGFCLLLVLCWVLASPTADEADRRRIVHWTVASLAAHFAFGFAVTNTPSAVYYLGGDAGTYHTYAQWLLEFGEQSLLGGLQTGKEGFYYTLAGLYRVFGAHPAAGLAMNATLAAALVPVVSDTARRLFDDAASRWVAPIVVLFPSIFLFTSQLLKEAPILFLFSVALNAAVRAAERITLGSTAMLAAAMAILLTFRGPIALVGAVGLIGGIALGKKEVVSGLTTGLVIVSVVAVMVLVLGVGSSGVRAALDSSNLQEATRVRVGLAYDAQSGIGQDVDTSTAGRALSYLPVGLARFTVGPFPWELRSLRQLPIMLDVAVLWYLFPMAWVGIRQGVKRRGRGLAVILVPAAALALVLSLSVGNLGILVRERMQVFVLVVPIIALGMAVRRNPAAEKTLTPAATTPEDTGYDGRPPAPADRAWA